MSFPGQVPAPGPSGSPAWRQEILRNKEELDLAKRDGRVAARALDHYLQQFGAELGPALGVNGPLALIVIRSDALYVMAKPTARAAYISAGLLARVDTEAELAGLIAHAFSHAPRVGAEIKDQCALIRAALPKSARPASRQSEREATGKALGLLKSAGYDGTPLLELLSKLAYDVPSIGATVVSKDLLARRAAIEREEHLGTVLRTDSSEFQAIRALVKAQIPIEPREGLFLARPSERP